MQRLTGQTPPDENSCTWKKICLNLGEQLKKEKFNAFSKV